MNRTRSRLTRSRLAALAVLSLLLSLALPAVVHASSHREAPAISEDPTVDDTDAYAFVSPEDPTKVVLVGNWIPAEEPSGGPNYFRFADAARYRLNVDIDGELPVDDVVYEFAFHTETVVPESALPPIDPTAGTFLAATGPIGALDDSDYNLRQYFTVTITDSEGSQTFDRDASGRRLLSPPNNIGPFSTPNYAQLAADAVYTLTNGVRVFAGQRDDPFFLDLGAVFDGLQLRPVTGGTLGQPGGGKDALAGFNVHTIAVEVPTTQLVTTEQPILGLYTSASRPRVTVLKSDGTTEYQGDFVQVSRLGFPLANELFNTIPTLKDQYNAAEPGEAFDVEILQPRLLNPEATRLLKLLFPGAFTDANLPPQDQRIDLVAAVLTGVPGLNRIGDEPAPADLLRLNTSLGAAKQPGDEGYSSLGVIAGDVTGFPNGRRPWDDIVDVELRVAAGVLYKALIAPTGPDFNVAPNNLLADGVDVNDKPYLDVFPFIALPTGGFDTPHGGPLQGDLEEPTATPIATATARPTATRTSGPPPTATRSGGGGTDDGCHITAPRNSGLGYGSLIVLLPAVVLWASRRRGRR